MNRIVFMLTVAFLLLGAKLYAADGNLVVNGNVCIGRTAPTVAGFIVDAYGSGSVFDYSDYGVNVGNSNSLAYINNRFQNDTGSVGYVGIGGSGVETAFANRAYVDSYGMSSGLSLMADQGDIRFYLGGYYSANEKVRIVSSGNVGIGVTSPVYQLQLSTGNAAKVGGGSWINPSDGRLKTNIQPYTKGLKEIVSINPVSYRYNGKGGIGRKRVCADGPAAGAVSNAAPERGKGGPASYNCETKETTDTELLSKTYVGIVAQDIQHIVPESISSHKGKIDDDDALETDILDFDAHSLTFILINAVKELDAQIQALNQQIVDLKAKVE